MYANVFVLECNKLIDTTNRLFVVDKVVYYRPFSTDIVERPRV